MLYIRLVLLCCLLLFVENLSASTQAKWRTVTSGWYHTLAIDHNGDLWAWGSNSSGQLGIPTLTAAQEYKPEKVLISEKPTVKWQKVFAGPYNSFALDSDGELWAWGANRYSVLGINETSTVILTPTKVNTFYQIDGSTPIENVVINNVQAASFGTIATSTNGELFVWGRNNEKQLFDATITVDGVETDVIEITAPRLKDSLSTWIDIAAADSATLGGYFAINDLGEAYFFGENNAGLSGTGINGGIFTNLTEIVHPESTESDKKKWVEIAAGKYKAVAIDEVGYALQWGDNVISPTNVPISTGNFKPFDSFATSPEGLSQASESLNGKVQVRTNYQAIQDKENDLYFWGLNKYFTTSSDKFFSGSNNAIRYAENIEKWKKVYEFAIQERSVIIVNEKRDIFAHGSNSSGQLGLQSAYLLSSSYSKIPQAWHRWSKVVAAGGAGHSLAIKAKDVCFKNDISLDLQTYSFNPADYNADICPAKETIENTFGVGPIWGWGDNSANQLTSAIIDPGENTAYIDKPSPLTMLDDSYNRKADWVDISSANNHVIALDVNGNLYAWGKNNSGQLGLGHTNSVSSATKLPLPNELGTKWKAVSTSDSHTLAIDTDGKLWAWGSNTNNQLGFTGTSLVPKQVGIDTEWQQVVAANGYSFALNSSGQRFAWGKNANEELGDSGIVDTFLEPTLIDSGWLMITASNGYGFGVKNDNKIYYWGAQTKQIANGETVETINVETPESFDESNTINDVTSWRQITSDGNTNFALATDGRLWAWGNNVNAQTGVGYDSAFNYSPTQVLSDYNYSFIDTSAKHSLGIVEFGLLTGWGYNEQAQTGSAKVFGETYALTPKEVFLTDRDGDGAFDHIDLFIDDPRFTVDTDGDGIVDELDDDSDNDGISDDDERAAGLNPFDPSDAALDSDFDGMTNLEELSVYQTCNHITDSSCSERESVPGPLNLSYIQNAIYKSALDSSLLNRRYFSFSSGEFTQDYPWASQSQIDSVESFIKENTSLSASGATGYYSELIDSSEGYDGEHSLKLTNVNKNVVFNSAFKTDEFANPTIRKLIAGSVFFSFKFSDNFDPSQDKLVVSLNGMAGTGITPRPELWSSSSQNTKNQWHIAKFDLTSAHLRANESYLTGFAQLAWKMVCNTSCTGKTVNIDTLSFPIEINEAGIPAEYKKLAGNGGATADSDSDGLSNLEEYKNGTDPLNPDTDGDGMSDGYEVTYGLNPFFDDASIDTDNDGLTNLVESQISTNPNSGDTDGDGLPDKWEFETPGVNPRVGDANKDTDGDGLTNAQEYANNTQPNNADSDGDGLTDKQEIDAGLDALNPDQDNDGILDGEDNDPLTPADSDGDGWTNDIERESGLLDENNAADVWSDSDSDGRPLILEVLENKNAAVRDNAVITDTRNFVLQAYADSINFKALQPIYYSQQSEQAEIDTKVAALDAGEISPSQIYVDLLVDSNSDLAMYGFIGRAYVAGLGRNPDVAGARYFREQLGTGVLTEEKMVENIVSSPEFTGRYGTDLSNSDFVTLVYQNVLGRTPDQNGLDFWVQRLNNGDDTRASLMLGFINSSEFSSDPASEQDSAMRVLILSAIVQGRLLSETELSTYTLWYKEDPNGLESVIRALIGEAYYHNRLDNVINGSDMDGDSRPDLVEWLEGTDPNVSDNDVTSRDDFIKQTFRDLLSELWSVDSFTQQVQNYNSLGNRGLWLSSFVRTNENYSVKRKPIPRLYKSAFLRQPDYVGLEYWINQYDAGMSLPEIAEGFTSSAEFKGMYDSMTDSQYIDAIYLNVLDRLPDTEGKTFWLNELQNGVTRAELLLGFSESEENQVKLENEVISILLYHGLVKREGTAQEISQGIAILDSGKGENLVSKIINSTEYQARF